MLNYPKTNSLAEGLTTETFPMFNKTVSKAVHKEQEVEQ